MIYKDIIRLDRPD